MANQTKPTINPDLYNRINNNQELAEFIGSLYWLCLKVIREKMYGIGNICAYDPYTSPYQQEIANTFDIDIQNEPPIIAKALTRYPIFAKAFLGTEHGVKKVLEPLLSHLEFKTHENTPDMPPYHFVVKADNDSGLDQKKVVQLINRFSCLRDNPPELILVDIICNTPFTLVTKINSGGGR